MAPRGRATQQSRDTRKTKQCNQLPLPHQDDCNTSIEDRFCTQQDQYFTHLTWVQISELIMHKIGIIFLPTSLNMYLGTQKNRLTETVLLDTYNISFDSEIRKIIFNYPCISERPASLRNQMNTGLKRVRNENLIFLFLNQNIHCGNSKEPSQ